MMTTNLFVIVNVKQLWKGGGFRILLPFFRTSWGAGVPNSAIFKLIRMLEWNTKHFPLNLHSGLILSNFWDVEGGFELWNQIGHCKTVCIKRNLYLINYNRMITQWTAKENRDTGSSCSCDRGLRRYLRNFRGGFEHPKPPLSVRHWPYVLSWHTFYKIRKHETLINRTLKTFAIRRPTTTSKFQHLLGRNRNIATRDWMWHWHPDTQY